MTLRPRSARFGCIPTGSPKMMSCLGGARPQTRILIDYIRTHRDRFGVERICAVFVEHGVKIAPSTYYAYAARGFGPTAAELSDAYVGNRVFDLWAKSRRLSGRRKLWKTARRAGIDRSRCL